MTEGWVDHLTGPWGFAFAFAAGVISFLSPCVLPLVPAYLAHLTGTTATLEADASRRRETLTHAVAFVAGFGVIFSLLGASVGLLGAAFGADDSNFVRDHQRTLEQIAGVLLVILGLNLMGVIRIPLLYRTFTLESASSGPMPAGAMAGGGTVTMGGGGRSPWAGLNYAKSFGVGSAFAIGWTPCIGPVLGAILTLSATSADVAQGMWLLVVYSLGLGVPFIITAFAVVPVTAFLRRIRGILPIIEIIAGAMVILVGALIFLDEATIFNAWFSDIPFLDDFNSI
jgi:cytochrome c-type biogenesis protein